MKKTTTAVLVFNDGSTRTMSTPGGVRDVLQWLKDEDDSFERDAVEVATIRTITFIKEAKP